MPRPKTQPSTPRLSEYARHFVYPDGIVKTVWPRVEAKGAELGLGFDWWQSQLGTVCLGYGKDGKYVATVGGIGLSIPRQVGKTYFVLVLLVILCVLFPGLQVVWTAHHLRTSTKTFTTLRGICRRKKVHPHIRAMRAANGEQQVEFTNGSMIMFGARSMGFGRGFDEIDVEVFDEAQILDTKALEDMIAATNQARHEHGALLFFTGTPPRPSDPSTAFTSRRKKAITGEAKNAVWLEIGAEPGSDPDDRAQWAAMNPSYPKRTPEESMLRLRENVGDDDSWNREGRGIWDAEDTSHGGIPLDSWADCLDRDSAITGALAFGVFVTPDRAVTSVATVGSRSDGLAHAEVVEERRGTHWVAEFVQGVLERNGDAPVVVDPATAGGSLIPELRALGVEPLLVTSQEQQQACGSLFDLVRDQGLRHIGQQQLQAAVENSTLRAMPRGGSRWSPKGQANIAALDAVTLALHGYLTIDPEGSDILW